MRQSDPRTAEKRVADLVVLESDDEAVHRSVFEDEKIAQTDPNEKKPYPILG
jgi:hypothetical protein